MWWVYVLKYKKWIIGVVICISLIGSYIYYNNKIDSLYHIIEELQEQNRKLRNQNNIFETVIDSLSLITNVIQDNSNSKEYIDTIYIYKTIEDSIKKPVKVTHIDKDFYTVSIYSNIPDNIYRVSCNFKPITISISLKEQHNKLYPIIENVIPPQLKSYVSIKLKEAYVLSNTNLVINPHTFMVYGKIYNRDLFIGAGIHYNRWFLSGEFNVFHYIDTHSFINSMGIGIGYYVK